MGTPEDLAVDWLTGNIYFTDVEYKHIGVCTSDGSHCTSLVNVDIQKPRGIVLDVNNGYVHFKYLQIDYHSQNLQREFSWHTYKYQYQYFLFHTIQICIFVGISKRIFKIRYFH